MLKLMKYEFKKTMISKFILLAMPAIGEAIFLIGVFAKWDKGLRTGIIILVLCAIFGVLYIGVESLLVFHRDLNTKQSYMLFLTPKNSYQILGAKILENGISILLTGLAFIGLAALDIAVAMVYLGGLQELLDFIQMVLRHIQVEISVSSEYVIVAVLLMLASWLLTITMADLSIVLSATFLAGKRFSGIVSFLFFLVLSFVSGQLTGMIPFTYGDMMYFVWMFLATFIQVGIFYLAAGWIMERKLSV